MGECVCDNWRRKEKAKRDKCTRQRWAPKIEGGQIEKTVKESIVISVFFSPYKMSQSLKWLVIAYFLVYNFEEKKNWHPDTYWHAVLKGWDDRKHKSIFGPD